MLSFDVSVPQLGEVTALEGGHTLLGDEKSVMTVLINEEGPVVAFQMPAARAMALSQDLWKAAREADPEGTSLLAHLRSQMGGGN